MRVTKRKDDGQQVIDTSNGYDGLIGTDAVSISPELMNMDGHDEGGDEQYSPEPSTSAGGKAKKSRMLTDESNVSKRTLQNRKAQREFRQRRANYMKELEDRIQELQSTHVQLDSEAHAVIYRLRDENANLRMHVQRLDPSLYFQLPPPIHVPQQLLMPPAHLGTGYQNAQQPPPPAHRSVQANIHALLPSHGHYGGQQLHGHTPLDALVHVADQQANVHPSLASTMPPLSQGIPAPLELPPQATPLQRPRSG